MHPLFHAPTLRGLAAAALAAVALAAAAQDTAPAAPAAVSPEAKYAGKSREELREALDDVSNEAIDLARGIAETKKELERAVKDPAVTSPEIAKLRAAEAEAEAALAAARDKLRAAVLALPEYAGKAKAVEDDSKRFDALRLERDWLRQAVRGRAEITGSRPAD